MIALRLKPDISATVTYPGFLCLGFDRGSTKPGYKPGSQVGSEFGFKAKADSTRFFKPGLLGVS
jgi:hypothetical protein